MDFAVGSFTISAQREGAIDFTLPFYSGDVGMLMRLTSEENKMFSYLTPFSSKVRLINYFYFYNYNDRHQ